MNKTSGPSIIKRTNTTMKKSIIIITLAVFIPLLTVAQYGRQAFSQSLDIIDYYQIDTTIILNEIQSKFTFDCNNYLMDKGDLHIFPFYLFLDTVSHSKDDYIDYTFLDDFKVLSHTASQVIKIDGYTITDSLGCILGLGGWAIDPCCYPAFGTPNAVFYRFDPTRFLYQNRLDFVFRTCHFGQYGIVNDDFLYGINMKEKQVYVIVDTRYGAELFPVEEIVQYHWNDFSHGLQELCHNVRAQKESEYNNQKQ